MEISPSDEEINIWMDKALDTVDHFTSIPVNPQSSLGKNTIKAGNTKSIIKSAERKARAVPDHANAAPNATVEPATDRPYQTVQPVTKPKQPRKARALPCPSSAPPVPPRVSEPQEEPYEELGAPAQEDTPLLKQAVPQSPSSGKLKSSQLPPLDNSNDSSNPSLSDQNIFKRGAYPRVPDGMNKKLHVTGESSTLSGVGAVQSSLSGATQSAPPSLPIQDDNPVGAGDAQVFANSVKEITTILQGMEARMSQIEWKVDKLLAQQSTITQIRNEQVALKAQMATIEGLLATVKIMDPGAVSSTTANQAKKYFTESCVVVSGPPTGDLELTKAKELFIGDLGTPTPNPPPQPQPAQSDSRELAGYKMTLNMLAKDCIPNSQQRQPFLKKIETIKSEQDFKKLKREIIRAAV
ncbi:phosphoprotein [Tuhoko virus 1]|uniref:Phosphoprotein n=1 Tax=Tuhoko virus 1 TaxID=798072 RepID=D8WJ23_9MONO|nr:phosphoprotein [Tuhoko virus 1]ADI80710.1 phosphoprotein [Tuhoko virus 1]